MSHAHYLTGRLAISAIYQLFGDRTGRFLRYCHLKFDKEVISDGFKAHSRVFRGGGLILVAELLWS